MIRNKNGAANFNKAVQAKQIKKMNRLIKSKPKWRTEMTLTEQDIADYIEHMKNTVRDEPKVANCLLKWQELKKKYENVSADKAAELDMEAFKKHGENLTEPDSSED